MKKILFLFIILSSLHRLSFSQDNPRFKLDSLVTALKVAKGDTNKVKGLNVLAWKLWYSKPDSSIHLSTQALQLAKTIKWQAGIENSEWTLGWLYYLTGKYILSLDHFAKAGKAGPYKYSVNEIRMVYLSMALIETNRQKQFRNFSLGGFALVLIFAVVFFIQRNNIKKEKKRSDDLLLNILPYEVTQELKQTGHCQAKTFSMVTVMFTDFIDFTSISEKISAELLVEEINLCFSTFDNIIQKYRVEKIKTVGDAYICASGLPILSYTHAFDLVSAAIEIRNFIYARKKEKEAKGEIPFELRIGIHTGPVVAGIVGVKKIQYDIWGDTVNLAARMESRGEAGKVNISGTTYALVKDKFACTYRGKIHAKNKGEIDMYFVENII